MSLPVRMLKKADIPSLEFMLADLGNPPAQLVAKALGVSLRSVRSWIARGYAPHATMIALFWHTSYGRSLIDVELVNTARMFAQLASSQAREMNNLKARIAHLETIGQFGSANSPFVENHTQGMATGTLDAFATAPLRSGQIALF
jgi:hypothetical protein